MFANWCEYCVRARALDNQHRRIGDDERRGDHPVVAFDFCFPGQLDAPVKMPVLVMKDDRDGGTRAHGLLTKSLNDERGVELVKQVVEDLKDTGYTKIIMKSDNEITLIALRDKVKAVTDIEVVPQHPVVRQSASNGMVENAVREVEGTIRTMKLALEGRLRNRIPPDHPILFWLVAHAAEVIDRCKVSSIDDKTARERRYGKRDRLPLAEFGEQVFFLPADYFYQPKLKMEAKLLEGTFVGVEARSNAYKAIDGNGMSLVRTVRRRLFSDRWSASKLLSIAVTPWQPRGGAPIDPRFVRGGGEHAAGGDQSEPGHDVRRLGLTKRDFATYGYTTGCRGCTRMRLGQVAQGHSDACRARVEQLLAQSVDGRARLERNKRRLDEAYYRLTKDQAEGETADCADAPVERKDLRPERVVTDAERKMEYSQLTRDELARGRDQVTQDELARGRALIARGLDLSGRPIIPISGDSAGSSGSSTSGNPESVPAGDDDRDEDELRVPRGSPVEYGPPRGDKRRAPSEFEEPPHKYHLSRCSGHESPERNQTLSRKN